MPQPPTPEVRLLAVAQVAEILGLSVDEVMDLVTEGQLRGMRVGSPARWRIDEASVADYLDDKAEEARRMALWRQSSTASFPELWGTGAIRNSD
ncbi:helix-turn-helix domain-containing protein [Microbacterium deminutum]|uniref:Helix-turn-helix domain-containing protein n=1 Tax=Microbacterium deminutum TaxID=344164 RepID=A0ABN2Q7R8_9MICO